MKRILISAICALIGTVALMGQAKKPTIMVVPSDVWCFSKGYVQTYDEMGVSKTVSDYRKALTSDMELKLVIAKINELMADRGFPLKDMEATLANIERSQAEEMAIVSKTSGSSVAESLLDRLRRVAKADIIIEIGWTLTQQGPRNTLTYVDRKSVV